MTLFRAPLRSTTVRVLTIFALASGLLVGLPTSASAAACSFPTPSTLPSVDGNIDDAADLQWLRDNNGQWGSTWTQTADIDMGGCSWSSGIGTYVGSVYFTGTYDGGGYTISNLDIVVTNGHGGLFGVVSGGTVQNANYAGSTSVVNTGATSPQFAAGGLVGLLIEGATISRSSATGDVSSTACNGIGGLVGSTYSNAAVTTTIEDSFASGNVVYAGGCNLSQPTYTGGLIGRAGITRANPIVVRRSYATGSVTTAANMASVGGFIGAAGGNVTMTEVFASGNVTTTGGPYHFGAFIGVNSCAVIRDAYATGSVSVTYSGGLTQTGGFVGSYDCSFYSSAIDNVYTAGPLTATAASISEFGGFAGNQTGNSSLLHTTSSFWNNTTSTQAPSSYGTPAAGTADVTAASTTQLTAIATFVAAGWSIAEGYDATYTWGICAAFNDGYPFLTGIYSSDPCTSPAPASIASPAAWPVFTFQTPGGGECTAISPQHPRLNSWFTLPDADAPCFIKGSVLTGWSIPGQDWAFAPGRRVWVVDSQTFTSVLEYEWVTIEYDSNIDAKDVCLSDGVDLPVPDRTGITHIPRNVITEQPLWTAPVCSAPGYEFLGWTPDYPHGDPTILPKDGTMPAPAVNSDGDAANVIHLYAMWKWVG